MTTAQSNELIRVGKREFVRVFSQLSCPGQTRTRVDESWLDIQLCIAKILINSHQNLNRWAQNWGELIRVHESRWELAIKRERVLGPRHFPLSASVISRQQKRCMATKETVTSREQILLEENGLYNSHQLSSPFVWVLTIGSFNLDVGPWLLQVSSILG
jgi:hypothetical protein